MTAQSTGCPSQSLLLAVFAGHNSAPTQQHCDDCQACGDLRLAVLDAIDDSDNEHTLCADMERVDRANLGRSAAVYARHLRGCTICRSSWATDNGSSATNDDISTTNDDISATMATMASPEADLTTAASTGRLDELPEVPSHYYDRRGEIARGGMGRIIDAVDLRANRTVAIKEVRSELLGTPGAQSTLRRFEREAKITAQLQHPSIVPVYEIGRFDGNPFYAMKMVSGRPLDEVIKQCTTIEERLALVPNVLAVAEAIAYAHDNGVIHRDLKPANVLIGAFGETVVIDWGLAKRLHEDDVEVGIGAVVVTADSDGLQTVAGAVMGTPFYMAPEQAVGQQADARSDVYALGAMLYHVLTGRAPMSEREFTTQDEVIEHLLAEGAQPIPTTTDGVPADLVSIVRRAMAKKPDERYPDASLLAGELRRFQDGQLVGAHHYSVGDLVRRWLRRNRAVVAISAIALVTLTTLGVVSVQRIRAQRTIAEQKRSEAEQHRAETQELMDFMMFELHKRLEPAGQLKLLGLVAERVSKHYAKRASDVDEPPRAQRHALAVRNLGDVRLAQGELVAARLEYRRALAMLSKLVERGATKALPELVRTNNALGIVARSQGKLGAALERHRSAQKLAEALVSNSKQNAAARLLLATTHDYIGSILRWQGNLDGALASYRSAYVSRKAVVEATPKSEEALLALSVSQQKLGNVLRSQGKLAAALAHYRAGMVVRQRLATGSGNAVRQRELSILQGKVADILQWQGNTQQALQLFRKSLQIRTALITRDPANPGYRRDVSFSYVKIGHLLLERGDVAAARKQQEAALAIRTQLARQDPSNSSWQRDLGWSHQYLGRVQQSADELPDATAQYMLALRIRSTLAAKDPANTRWQNDLMEAHTRVGEVLLLRSDVAGATTQYNAAVAIGQRLVRLDASNTMWKHDLSAAYKGLGDAHAKQDAKASLSAYEAARNTGEQVVRREPKRIASLQLLAAVYEAIGDQQLGHGQSAAARTSYAKSLALLKSVAAHSKRASPAGDQARLRGKLKRARTQPR